MAEAAASGETDLDTLFVVAPADFVGVRDALVDSLRAQGERDAADEIARLRRPPPPVWAANQLARRHANLAAELAVAGEQLRVAQTRALAGNDPAGLRQAQSAHRAAIAALMDAAGPILAEIGATSTQTERLRALLAALAPDAETSRLFVSGHLTEFVEPVQMPLGDVDELATEPERSGVDDRRRRAVEAAIADARAVLAVAEERANAADAGVESTRNAAIRAQEQAEAAHEALEAARDALIDAEADRDALGL